MALVVYATDNSVWYVEFTEGPIARTVEDESDAVYVDLEADGLVHGVEFQRLPGRYSPLMVFGMAEQVAQRYRCVDQERITRALTAAQARLRAALGVVVVRGEEAEARGAEVV